MRKFGVLCLSPTLLTKCLQTALFVHQRSGNRFILVRKSAGVPDQGGGFGLSTFGMRIARQNISLNGLARSRRVGGFVNKLLISKYIFVVHKNCICLNLSLFTVHKVCMARKEVRLASKDLFLYFSRKVYSEMEEAGVLERKRHRVGGVTNKRKLALKTGIGYETLVTYFTRKGKTFFDNGDVVILKMRPDDIQKGDQSMARKGKGGMERFMLYVAQKNRVNMD